MIKTFLLAFCLFLLVIACSPSAGHLMVIGNSITRHAPAPELGWHGDWGMAATAQERDWVHLVWSEMPEGTQLTIVHCTAPNLSAQANDLASQVEEAEPTVLIIQVGDNILPEDATEETLRDPIRQITEATDAKIIIVGVWRADDIRNTLLAEVARDAGARFVPIHDIREMKGCQAWDDFGDGPVGWHPSDLGMKMIAERVIEGEL